MSKAQRTFTDAAGLERTIVAEANEHGWYRLEMDAVTLARLIAGLHFAGLGQAPPPDIVLAVGQIGETIEVLADEVDLSSPDWSKATPIGA